VGKIFDVSISADGSTGFPPQHVEGSEDRRGLHRHPEEITIMLTNLAALGIGLITAVGTPVAAHAAPCTTPTSSYPSYGTPGHGPVPTYAPAPPPRPHLPPARRVDTRQPDTLRWADRNRDGSVTAAEARAFARTQFNRGDADRNGVLRGRELDTNDDFARAASGRDGRVTHAEYETRVMNRFYSLDINRDSYLSRYELGTDRTRTPLPPAPRANTVTWSWNWSS
jgi:hypothetical protein